MGVRSPRILVATLVLLLAVLSARSAKAESILSSTGTPVPSNFSVTSYQTVDFPDMIGIAFVLGQQFDNVSVTFEGTKVAFFSGEAWLTNGVGPGATSANVIATQTFSSYTFNYSSVPITYFPIPTLFGNVDLSPGTYYVILSSQPCQAKSIVEDYCDGSDQAAYLGGVSSSAVAAAPNAGYLGLIWSSNGGACEVEGNCPLNTEFPPASNFLIYSPGVFGLNPAFEIDGTPHSVPEPATVSLAFVGLFFMFFLKARTQPKASNELVT